jgi:cytochrome c oxidase assembly factor CtaG
MNYFTQNWGHPWVFLFAVAVVGIHWRGLRALNRRSTAQHAIRRSRRFLMSYLGLALVALSICSPLEYWSMQYFWVHMLQHISVMLAAPALYVAGAPTLALVHAVPVGLRRRVLRVIYLHPAGALLRRVGRFIVSPVVAVLSFNAVMVIWMLPALFDPVMQSETLHIGLMLSTFFISGLLFWLQILPSYPFKPMPSPVARAGALLFTNLVMTLIAMTLSFFAAASFYKFAPNVTVMGSHVMPMANVTLNRFADQQIGAAILWVCGDFWCYPALVLAIQAALRDGADSGLVDRYLRGHRSMSASECRGGNVESVDDRH